MMVTPREVAGGIVVISAAAAGQISGALKDKEHGLFTYYLLKGLGGEAGVKEALKILRKLRAKSKLKVIKNG